MFSDGRLGSYPTDYERNRTVAEVRQRRGNAQNFQVVVDTPLLYIRTAIRKDGETQIYIHRNLIDGP